MPLTVPCTALTAGKLPAVRAVQGDCEAVYGSAPDESISFLSRRTQFPKGFSSPNRQTSFFCKISWSHEAVRFENWNADIALEFDGHLRKFVVQMFEWSDTFSSSRPCDAHMRLHCGIWHICIVGFVTLVYCSHANVTRISLMKSSYLIR